jgi:uncharacterized protein YyaL (SSP411 family)
MPPEAMTMRALLFLFALLPTLPASAQLSNRLLDHPSPYLAMHGHDPVHWQTWGEEAFAAARREHKLLFVSDGYFSCHWCHVMQRESYRDPEIAKLLNQHFIPVKVDRELNPALDAYLVDFLENTQGYSGWPLNVFITPDGHPLVGLVYLPPGDFRALLVKVSTLWEQDRQALARDAARAARELAARQRPARAHTPDAHDIRGYQRSLMNQLWQLADEMQGGFGEQSKFPMVPQMRTLLRLYAGNRDARLGHFLRLTLDQMASQGLHDQIGGGFFRYTVDPGWQVPHFEKMLYDNAQLAGLYLQAAEVFHHPAYRRIGLDTLDFMLREMHHPEGGFISSLSALDAQNIEGGYYLWRTEQLKQILAPEEYTAASHYWKLQGTPPLDGGYHAVQAESLEELAKALGHKPSQVKKTLASARQKLFHARQQRRLPRDDKRLAAWNGLALSALSRAVRISDEPRYRHAAEETAAYLLTRLWDGQTLMRARSARGSLGQAGIQDYALVAQGLSDWYEINRQKKKQAIHAMLAQAWRRYYDRGWSRSEESFLQYANRDSVLADDVLPSPSATLIGLSLQAGDKALNRKAREALALSHTVLQSEPFWYVGYLDALQGEEGKP